MQEQLNEVENRVNVRSHRDLLSNGTGPSTQFTRVDQLVEPGSAALTAGYSSKSAVTVNRHLQQGLMRSEKVYALTKLVNDKIEQLDRGNRTLK